MPTSVYCYAPCTTCAKALTWLDRHGVVYDAIDIVAHPPSKAALKQALAAGIPLKKLFNTSGVSYRTGNWSEKLPHTSESDALDALAADGKLIKRPFILTDEGVLVGFDEGGYKKAFLKR